MFIFVYLNFDWEVIVYYLIHFANVFFVFLFLYTYVCMYVFCFSIFHTSIRSNRNVVFVDIQRIYDVQSLNSIAWFLSNRKICRVYRKHLFSLTVAKIVLVVHPPFLNYCQIVQQKSVMISMVLNLAIVLYCL